MIEWLARDGKLILLEKAVRTVPFGFLGVVFPIYLSQLGFAPILVGLVIALTTVTSAFYTLVASLVADRLGRKRTLIFFALTDTVAGFLLFSVASAWAVIAAGIVGNMSVGAGEVGPYLSLKQSIFPKSIPPSRRTLGFGVYNLIGYGASATGASLADLPQFGQTGLLVYRPLFLAYMISGLLGALLYSQLSQAAEKARAGTSRPITLSKASRPTILKLSGLFGVDAFAGGFIGSSIVAYYFYLRYGLDLGSLGLIVAATQIVTAISFLVSARIASRIGLVRTMVFTHLPSNIVMIALPFAPSVSGAVALLLVRQSMSQMDVAPRQSLVVSIVPESDRTAGSGITNSSRSFSQSVSPFLAGYAIENVWVGAPFVFAGTLKIAYDLLLYRSFHNTKPDLKTIRVSEGIDSSV